MKKIVVEESISIEEVRELARDMYKDMVKGVADIEREIIALGGEYHVDANELLLKSGSQQKNVWGFNVYLDRIGDDWIECASLINIRPVQGNRSMFVKDTELTKRIRNVVERRIIKT